MFLYNNIQFCSIPLIILFLSYSFEEISCSLVLETVKSFLIQCREVCPFVKKKELPLRNYRDTVQLRGIAGHARESHRE